MATEQGHARVDQFAKALELAGRSNPRSGELSCPRFVHNGPAIGRACFIAPTEYAASLGPELFLGAGIIFRIEIFCVDR
jgi:hypothetical protein